MKKASLIWQTIWKAWEPHRTGSPRQTAPWRSGRWQEMRKVWRTAQSVGSMHETSCGKPPECCHAWLQLILLNSNLLVMQLQPALLLSRNAEEVTQARVHREPEPTPPPPRGSNATKVPRQVQTLWHPRERIQWYTKHQGFTAAQATPCTEQKSIRLEKTKFLCLTPSL